MSVSAFHILLILCKDRSLPFLEVLQQQAVVSSSVLLRSSEQITVLFLLLVFSFPVMVLCKETLVLSVLMSSLVSYSILYSQTSIVTRAQSSIKI